ncbi:MAG: MGMT family protein [Chloroflexi bacterium]|nr:MGMT family protein [Chloroflexota bacterium]
MAKKTTWTEKLNNDRGLPRVQEVTDKMCQCWGTGTFVIPAPREVNEIMRQVPKGKLTTINEIRKKLANKHGTSIACPITTGIFAWVSAHAAEEAYAAGKKDITPWWRTLKTGGELNPKYPGGAAEQAARLMSEGHTILPGNGKKPPAVKDYEKKPVEV